jgi:hypothetical protein
MANPEFVKRYAERGIEMKASASPEEFTPTFAPRRRFAQW